MRAGTKLTLALAFAMLPGAALAHTGAGGAGGLTHGFAHPLGGLDHVLAMLAVGLFAACLGGRALWLVPATFLLIMAAGGALGMAGADVPFVELGIAGSVIVLGLAVALRWKPSTVVAMALVAFFAVFHGHAHGAEMPADSSGLSYALGFVAATALLHLAGIGLGVGIGGIGTRSRLALQSAGGAMALTGVGILVGLL